MSFGVSIFDNNEYHVTSDGNRITVIDHSNYDTNTESGHLQADFEFKKIVFINPDNTEYVFSTQGDGDEMLSSPSVSVLPITTYYNYTTGDGVYTLIMYTVPTWRADANYTTLGQHHVIHNGVIYKCIVNNTNSEPTVGNASWVIVDDIDNLPSKYRLYYRFAVYCGIVYCYLNKVYSALCAVDRLNCGEDLCKSKVFMDAVKLGILIDNIIILASDEDWTGAAHAINLATQICCCYE
jgi:hypothetical protein